MKLPRSVAAAQLIKALEKADYEKVRQRGSHVRLYRPASPPHFITVPLHNPLKIGTLNSILDEVSAHIGIAVEDLINLL